MLGLLLAAEAAGSTTTTNGWWIAGLATFLGVLVLGKELFVRKPTIEAEFLTKAEFQTFRQEQRDDTRRIFMGLEDLRASMHLDGERRSEGIKEKLEETNSIVARLDERTNHLWQQFERNRGNHS